jgi:hypothetical protein
MIVSFFAMIIILISTVAITLYDREFFADFVAPFHSTSQEKWWQRDDWKLFAYPMFSYGELPSSIERFEDNKKREDELLAYPPNKPDVADIYNNKPYHLLKDVPPPRDKEAISCVNSRSCYATDFDRMINKVGTFRQLTNNFKREYPDNCTTPYQELNSTFYKVVPMQIPAMNTGGSVSYM